MSNSKVIIKVAIKDFFNALINRDTDSMQSLFEKNAMLTWGPYLFTGREEIMRWAKEFGEKFPHMRYMETRLSVKGNRANQDFVLEIETPYDCKGLIQCKGSYEFKKGIVQSFKIMPQNCVVLIKKEDVIDSIPFKIHLKSNYRVLKSDSC